MNQEWLGQHSMNVNFVDTPHANRTYQPVLPLDVAGVFFSMRKENPTSRTGPRSLAENALLTFSNYGSEAPSNHFLGFSIARL
jgi:hypothetical protein